MSKRHFITGIIVLLNLIHLIGQTTSDFDNIILEDSFKDKNLHDVLMDVNASKMVFIAYDVHAAEQIIIPKSYKNQSLSSLLNDLVTNDIKKVNQGKYLIQIDEKPIEKQEQNHFISGQVRDEHQTPIPYALVAYQNKNAVYADENGKFKIKVNSSHDQLLCVQMLGFETVCHQVSDQIDHLNFILKNNPIELDAILLERSPVKAKIKEGNFEIQMKTYIKQNSIGGDIFRSLKLIPSIHTKNDLSADIKFRNTYVEENLMQFEQIPLFMTTHMYGFFSSINNLAVGKISIYPNYVPVEYLSRTGGMVLLENNKQEHDKQQWQGKLDIDFLSAKAAFSYKSEKTIAKITGRKSIGSVSNKKFYSLATQEELVLDKNSTTRLLNPEFKFQDFTAYFEHQFDSIWSLKFSLLHLQDQNHYALNSIIKIANRKDTHMPSDSLELKRSIGEDDEIIQNGIGMNLKAKWNEKWTSNLNITASKYRETDATITSTSEKRRHKNRILIEQFDYENNLTFSRFQISTLYQPSTKQYFNFGLNAEQYSTHIVRKTTITPPFSREKIIRSDIPSEDIDFTGFLSWKYDFAKHFTLLSSAKTTYNSKLKNQFFSPRIQLIYSPNLHWSFGMNAQSSYQILRKIYSENPFGKPQNFWIAANNRNIKPLSSQSLSLNTNYQSEGWIFTNTIYFRRSKGLTEWVNIIPGYRQDSTIRSNGPKFHFFTGRGKGTGLEMMVSKRTGHFQTWLSYRLSKSIENYPQLYNGNWIPAADDQRHNFHFVSNYNLNQWALEFTYQYGSGRRYLDITTLNPDKNRDHINPHNFKQLSDYHRLDFSVSYHWKSTPKTSDWRLTASIFNMLDTKNSYYRQYPLLVPKQDGQKQSVVTGTDFNQLGRFWNLRLEVGF